MQTCVEGKETNKLDENRESLRMIQSNGISKT